MYLNEAGVARVAMWWRDGGSRSGPFQDLADFLPVTLDQLVPDYLEAVPLDAFDATGLPIRYRREKPDRAVVWSIGPNRTDDDGEVGDSALGNTPDYGRVLR